MDVSTLCTNACRQRIRTAVIGILAISLSTWISPTAMAQTANWIWTSAHEQGAVPIGPTHYRKNFTLNRPVRGELVIAADDEFQVYFNGQLIGYGAGYDELTRIDLTMHLRNGDNLLAIRATNTQGANAALSAIVRFQLEGETAWRWTATDPTWKSSGTVTPTWVNRRYDDSGWIAVNTLGEFGTTKQWDAVRLQANLDNTNNSLQTATGIDSATGKETAIEKKFNLPEDFEVKQILDSTVGSLIALEFNEFGQLIISREGGKLLLADLSQSQSGEVVVRKYCDAIENVQGILPLNGDVYVTGSGPDGMALYRLSDPNKDGMLEPVKTLALFRGEPGEHGPHGIALGPDGMIYVMIGNASGLKSPPSACSAVTSIHEGEIVPRMEDPGGHAVGIRAPGGTVVRVSTDGSKLELVAVGLRNAYDMAFNSKGDLFFQDSDMESDIGTPWYRPTQVYHLTDGGEYGWRSGTAVFPYYFVDNLPGIADTGRGSPTGAVVYDHYMMPMRYHGALFLGDWSTGRIMTAILSEDGDTYSAEVEPFLTAEPLAVTDLAVGPDGALYFSTGGRGTEGGVYRVSWKGTVPDSFTNLDDPLSQLVRQPQPQSAWTRQTLAKIKSTTDDQSWNAMLRGILMESHNESAYRLRAFSILSLYGPIPSDADLIHLSGDADAKIRQASARALSFRDPDIGRETLVKMLSDTDPIARRIACNALVHLQIKPSFDQISHILGSESRVEAIAARRLLETMDVSSWRSNLFTCDNTRQFLNGSISLLIIQPTIENAYDVLAEISRLQPKFTEERDVLDMLRTAQLALAECHVDPEKIPEFSKRILEMFPAESGPVNREISRVLGYMNEPGIGARLPAYLESSSNSDLDKLQVLLNLRGMTAKFAGAEQMAAIAFLENFQTTTSHLTEGNHNLFLAGILESWTSDVDSTQVAEILKNGAKWPSAALAAFYKLPERLDETQATLIIEIDRQLKGRTESNVLKTRVGCIAILGRSADEQSMKYLREVWQHEPVRRNDVTLALAQQPDGDNWPYLISSLGNVSDDTASEVLKQLLKVNKRPSEPAYLRQTILTGYRLRESGAQSANQLMQHWTGNRIDATGTDWRTNMDSWARWFNEKWPNETPVKFDEDSPAGIFSVDQVLSWMETNRDPAKLHDGMMLFTSAQCSSCHRFKGQGESLGPDLTSITKRFSRREILRSILMPSDVVSDQFAGKKVLTTDGRQLTGLLTKSGDNYVLLQTDGKKVMLAAAEIEEILPLTTSVMPDGLLDRLSLEQIRDLMAWLYSEDDKVANKPAEIR